MGHLKAKAWRSFVLITLLSGALGACSKAGSGEKSGNNEVAESSELPRIEQLSAIKAKICLCEMAGRDTRALSSQYEGLIQDLNAEKEATASAPFRYTVTCFPELGVTACLAEPISYGDGFVCIEAHEKQLEQHLNDAMSANDAISSKATSVFRKKLQAIKDELAKSLPQSRCNQL